MPIKFNPAYTITPSIMRNLMRIESIKEQVISLPLHPTVLRSLRETARLYTTHYSTMIEGNQLAPNEIEEILKHMSVADTLGQPDYTSILKKLDPRQCKALDLFQAFDTITSRQIAELFGFPPRTSTALCADWVQKGFLEVVDTSKKGRKYRLSSSYQSLIK